MKDGEIRVVFAGKRQRVEQLFLRLLVLVREGIEATCEFLNLLCGGIAASDIFKSFQLRAVFELALKRLLGVDAPSRGRRTGDRSRATGRVGREWPRGSWVGRGCSVRGLLIAFRLRGAR
jgi:hypothetical protein